MRTATKSPTRSTRSRSTVAPPAPAPDPVADDTTIKRLSFPLKADGTIDAESLRTSTKESLRRVLMDPALGEALGVQQAQNTEDAALLRGVVGGVYQAFNPIAIAMAKRAGYSDAQALVAAFTSADIDRLADPTAKVIDKHFPNLGGKYRDEIMLCLAIAGVIAAKIQLLRAGARMMPDGSIVIGPAALQDPPTPIRSTVAPTTEQPA